MWKDRVCCWRGFFGLKNEQSATIKQFWCSLPEVSEICSRKFWQPGMCLKLLFTLRFLAPWKNKVFWKKNTYFEEWAGGTGIFCVVALLWHLARFWGKQYSGNQIEFRRTLTKCPPCPCIHWISRTSVNSVYSRIHQWKMVVNVSNQRNPPPHQTDSRDTMLAGG